MERNINGPGVDTQSERDQINYKPTIEHTKPVINANYYQTPSNLSVIIQSITEPVSQDIWTRSQDILSKLKTMQSDFDLRLKDSYATIPEKLIPVVTVAAQRFGYQVDNKLPFALYKNILLSNDSHEKIILQDAFENYYADVDGNLVAELYPDIVDMIEDWNDTNEFIKSGIFSQFVSKDQLNNLSYIKDKESQLSEAFIQAKTAYDISAKDMRMKYILDSESQDYFDAHKIFIDSKRIFKDLERRIFTKNEVATLVDAKLSAVEPFINLLQYFVNADAYKGKASDLLYSLLSQYTSGQEAEKGLRKIQALLKLSIDGKIENVDTTKMNLRNISSNDHKKNVNQSLIKSIHVRNEVYGNVFDTMDAFTSPPNDPVFDMVASHIVDSIHRADSIYTEQSSDFQKINDMDLEVRREKLTQVVDKDTARRFYQIINNLISYAKQKGNWPNASQLSSWLKDFIDHNAL